ncbi:MAG: heparinase II/III family protein [Pseudomonadota bacterium]
MGSRSLSSVPNPRLLASSVVERLQKAWGESPFYEAQLRGPAPDRLSHRPSEPYLGDKALGTAIAEGKLSVGTDAIDCQGELGEVWRQLQRDTVLHGYLHRFAWLRQLAALGEPGRAPARALTAAWLDAYARWTPDAWQPFLTGERLIALCCYGDLIVSDNDVLWKSRVLTSMARQTRHLAHAGHRAGAGYERLMTSMALTIAGLSLPGCDPCVERGLELLRRELRLQIRPDGGHLSRNPSRQLEIVVRLRMVIAALEARRQEIPGFLTHVIGRASAHLQLFRVGDGGLAIFNGGAEDDPKALTFALHYLDTDYEPVEFARHSGFQRLEAHKSVLIVDAGVTRNGGGISGYLGDGAFHFSSGRARLITNCGGGAHLAGDWRDALRLAAAHSTLSSEPHAVFASQLVGSSVNHRRGEDEDGHLLEVKRVLSAGGNGPAAAWERRLFLAADGEDLRGQDTLINPAPGLAANWRARFHLHPSVKASMSRDKRTVILALSNGEGWRFRTNCKNLHIERSIYCGHGGAPQAAEQIVLSGDGLERPQSGDMVIKWGFKCMSAG